MGLEVGIRHARKHLAAYSEIRVQEGADISAVEREKIVTTGNEQEVISLLSKFFAPEERRSVT